MRLRDLLDAGELPLTLLTGAEALDRPIRWVYTTDLPDPGRYLTGSELVLTGLMWRTGPADSRRFVDVLATAGVTALGAGDARYGSIPADLVDACRVRGLPLLEVPAEISFGAVTELVVRRLAAERTADRAGALGRHRQLISAVAAGGGLDAVLAATRADLGCACWVLSPTGRTVAGAALPDGRGQELAAAFLGAERLPRVAGSYTVLPVDESGGHRVTSWFLAVEGDLADLPEGGAESVYELAALAALDRVRVAEGRRVERRLLADLLATAGDAEPGQVAAQLRSCGLPAAEPYVAVAAAVSEVAQPADVGCAVLEELADGFVAAPVGTTAVTLLPVGADGAERLVGRLREAARLLGPGLSRGRLTVGVSAPARGPGGLRGAVDEAGHTRDLATLRPGRVNVVTSDDIHTHVLLLAAVPDSVRRSFRDRLLRPLYDYDAEHHSDLISTLEAFLDCSGSWSRCAARLHVHVNTLRYRIGRIEELTGRDLATLEDRVDFFLALRAG
ncbi:MAG TPA: PucR family transcriptional regulator [Streptosporangiaceae bacterium]